MSDPLWEAGDRVRREVLGDEHVDRQSTPSDFQRPFQEYLTRSVWGSLWTREGLDRRTRSCVTLAVLTALGRTGEIPLHVRAAVRNGLTEQEISEVLLHTAAYAGVPAARTAFEIAERTLHGSDGP